MLGIILGINEANLSMLALRLARRHLDKKTLLGPHNMTCAAE
jgi:hypothetical protein